MIYASYHTPHCPHSKLIVLAAKLLDSSKKVNSKINRYWIGRTSNITYLLLIWEVLTKDTNDNQGINPQIWWFSVSATPSHVGYMFPLPPNSDA